MIDKETQKQILANMDEAAKQAIEEFETLPEETKKIAAMWVRSADISSSLPKNSRKRKKQEHKNLLLSHHCLGRSSRLDETYQKRHDCYCDSNGACLSVQSCPRAAC
jgi:hypothetical protein